MIYTGASTLQFKGYWRVNERSWRPATPAHVHTAGMIQPALLAAPLGNSNALKTQLPAARFGPQAVCYFCDCGALWVTESDVKVLSPAAGDTTPKRIVSRRRRTMSPSMGPPCSDIP